MLWVHLLRPQDPIRRLSFLLASERHHQFGPRPGAESNRWSVQEPADRLRCASVALRKSGMAFPGEVWVPKKSCLRCSKHIFPEGLPVDSRRMFNRVTLTRSARRFTEPRSTPRKNKTPPGSSRSNRARAPEPATAEQISLDALPTHRPRCDLEATPMASRSLRHQLIRR